MKNPTCAEIAGQCQVSAATVSRALNNHRAIPKATRQRIVAAAKKMGWQPNPLASAYMAHLRSTRPSLFQALLAVVVDFPMPNGPEDLPNHVLRTYSGFRKRALEYGYGVKVFSLAESTPPALGRAMADWNIPGFLITSMNEPGKVLRGIRWSHYAMVALGHSMQAPRVHRVVSNMPMGVKFAIEQVLRMGYRRIGIAVAQEYDLRTNHGVMYPASYISRDLRRGESINVFVYRDADPGFRDAIADWLRETRPELVMGMFGDEVFDRLGWQVPRDIARVAFDRSPGSPSQAGLDLRYEVLGSQAADVLISEITLNRRGIPANPVEYTLPCQWVSGSSAPPRRR